MSRLSGEIDEIDGLRGLAIGAVMVHRLWPRDAENRFAVAADAGWIGVDLFFVISGFLITRILLDTRGEPGYFRNFYARRLLRIFPLYYLFVGTLLIAFPLAGNSSYLDHSGSPLWYLSFLGNIPEALLGKDPPYWLAPVWSLAIEEQFYLTFPWLVLWLGPQRLGRALLFLFILAPVVRLATMLAWPDQERIQYMFTLCRVDAIAAGCAVALIMRWRNVASLRDVSALIALCAFAIAIIADLDRTTPFGRVGGYSFVAVGFAALLVAVLTGRDQWWCVPLRFAPLRYIGKLCFGLYLLHRPADTIVTAVANRMDVDADRISWIPIKIAVAVAMATACWFVIEKPILKFKRFFVSRRHPSAGVLAGAAVVVLLAGCEGGMPMQMANGPDAGTHTPTVDAIIEEPVPDGGTMPPTGHVLYAEGRRHSPITPGLVARLQQVAGSEAKVFAKVGDSITDTASFLACFDGGATDLGDHAALGATIEHFGKARIGGVTPYARDSEAARGGWTASDLLAGMPCGLERELTLAVPEVGVMLVGTNDNRYGRPLRDYVLDLWAAVDAQLAAGTIPVLSTLPALHSYPEANARVPLFNLAIRAIAQGRQVPLVDLHATLAPLPNQGISADGIHPSIAPAGACSLASDALEYGYNARNLITLEALARVRVALAGTAPEAAAVVRQGQGSEVEPFRVGLPIADIADTRGAETVDACGADVPGVVWEVAIPSTRQLEVHAIGRAESIAIMQGTTCIAEGRTTLRASVPAGTLRVIVYGTTGESAVVVR